MQRDKSSISECEYTDFRQNNMALDRMISVREMIAADAAAVAEIEKETFSLPWSENGFLDAIKMENTICLTAEYDGKIAGYCVLYCAADEGNISTIAVNPQFRRRGVADLLLSRTKQETEKRQVVSIYLEVRTSNLPARCLYEKHGFVPNGFRKNFYQKPQEDALLMVYQMGVQSPV